MAGPDAAEAADRLASAVPGAVLAVLDTLRDTGTRRTSSAARCATPC